MKKFISRNEIPEWVVVPTATLHGDCLIGKVIGVWFNHVKIQYAVPPGTIIRGETAIGIYTSSLHVFREPTLSDWIAHAERFGDI